MTSNVKLLPLPSWAHKADKLLCDTDWLRTQVSEYARDNVANATAPLQAEIEALRAALESLKAHNGNAVMSRNGIIKALEEVRDEQGAEIHRLRAEMDNAKGQAEFYRTQRNKNQRKAERMAEALHRLTDACDDSDGAQYGTLSTTFVRGVCEGGLEEKGN